MARIRTIKPEFFRHEELYQAEKESGLPLRVAFAGLFTVADREGRFKWKPKQLKFDVLPYDEVEFSEVMDCLDEYGFIIKYEVDEKMYGCIPSFKDHQVINNKESKSILPEPTREKTCLSRDAHASLTEGKGREGKGREGNIQVAGAVCSIFGKHYLLPDERMPAQANFFRTIDEQAKKILTIWEPETAVKQIKAYLKHCKKTERKVIATDYKVAETLLSCDWVAISGPEPVPKGSEFSEAAYYRTLWSDEAWQKQYQKQIQTNPTFREYFKITTP
jgi:hypothetical protein